MTVKPFVTFYTIVCDGCGRDAFEDYESGIWDDKDDTIEALKSLRVDWTEADGKHWCPECSSIHEALLP